MSRYIDADTAIEKFNEAEDNKGYLKGDPETILNSIPTADVRPVVHAHMVEYDPYLYECSNCGYNMMEYFFNYCPTCGAVMDEGVE